MWLRVFGVIAVLILTAIAGLYSSANHHFYAARQARRNDDCAAAEQHLIACWQLSSLVAACKLEDELLGVQQGDLRAEKRWQQRAERIPAERALIVEALAKGNLATFQFNQALDYANAILDRGSGDAIALWIRGRALEHLQQEPQALEDYRQAAEVAPQSFEIQLSLGKLLHMLGNTSEAIAKFHDLHRQRPDDERVIAALAQCWQEQAELKSAQKLLDDFLVRHSQAIVALVERARLALRLSEVAQGEQFARRAIELKPADNAANQVLRLCLQAQHKTEAALDERIAGNERQQAEYRLKMHEGVRQAAMLTDFGRWALRSGDAHEAVGWFYAAVQEDAAHSAAHAGLAEYFAGDGQRRRSAHHAKLAGIEPAKIAGMNRHGIATEELQASKPAAIRSLVSSKPVVGTAHPTEASTDDVRRLCAACHAYPPPETFPRAAWRKEVKQGYDFLRASALSGDFPPLEDVVRYYEKRAPERLPAIEPLLTETKPPVKFAARGTGWMVNLPPYPGVANVNLASLLNGDKQELVLCDTRLDRVLAFKPYANPPAGDALPQVIAPSHTAVVDLDRDGRQDVLVAGLGSFFPTDDRVGKVVWMRGLVDGKFEADALLEGVGRVSDVEAADFNGDGKLDLIVAVFGWRTAGEILYLENQTTNWSQPQFGRQVVEARHGSIHVPVVDLNQDGRPDFVALISQEHETVVAYINQGGGSFEANTIFTAPHPSYGSSGIEVVDLDGDGDRDVLLTNGDVLDRPYLLKPYHGVQWLENKGEYPFEHHTIAAMYGASRAVAADFDGDKDLDVVAVSFLPRLEFPDRESLRLPSVALFEQTENGRFKTHVLEVGACDHFTCTAGDWDGDGRIDFAVGNFSWKRSQPFGDAARLWKNAGANAE